MADEVCKETPGAFQEALPWFCRGFLKSCDILLYRGRGFVSRLIQWGTKSPYSHVAVVVEPSIFLAVESSPGHQSGVRAIDLRKLPAEELAVFRIRSEFSFDPEKVISFLVAHLGASFDYTGVAWLGILKAVGLLTSLTHRPYNRFQKEKDYFCSELCYKAFQAAGLDIVPEVGEAETTSPADIASSARLHQIKP